MCSLPVGISVKKKECFGFPTASTACSSTHRYVIVLLMPNTRCSQRASSRGERKYREKNMRPAGFQAPRGRKRSNDPPPPRLPSIPLPRSVHPSHPSPRLFLTSETSAASASALCSPRVTPSSVWLAESKGVRVNRACLRAALIFPVYLGRAHSNSFSPAEEGTTHVCGSKHLSGTRQQ